MLMNANDVPNLSPLTRGGKEGRAGGGERKRENGSKRKERRRRDGEV